MNVLSLFDGMSCGRIALERAGIPVTNYYASEINKFAIKVSKNNWPDIKHVGSVLNVRIPKGEHIDLLIGGSPCQGFSFAGKQLNFEDPRSKLFFEYVRILKEIRRYNPEVKFLLENVKMQKEFEDVISNELGVLPIKINSQLVSAQTRKRIYWTNINNGQIPQPNDKGLLIKDIIEDQNINENSTLMTGKFIDYVREKELKNITSCNGMMVNTEQRTTLANERRINQIRALDQKATCLTCSSVSIAGSGGVGVYVNGKHRRITRIEAERLQNVPEGYTNCVSEGQAITMLGNGWTVDVISHIFSFIN